MAPCWPWPRIRPGAAGGSFRITGWCTGIRKGGEWSSEDEAEAREAARRIGDTRPDVPDCMILGPAPAPMAQLRGRYRYRLLMNARRSVQLQDVIRNWLGRIDHPPGVRVAVDVDPYSFV